MCWERRRQEHAAERHPPPKARATTQTETADARLRNPGVDRFVIRRGGRRIGLPRQRVASATGIGKEQGQKTDISSGRNTNPESPSAFPVETTTKRPLHVRHTEPTACSNHNSTTRGRHAQVSRRPPLPSSAIRRPDLRNEPTRRFGWPKARTRFELCRCKKTADRNERDCQAEHDAPRYGPKVAEAERTTANSGRCTIREEKIRICHPKVSENHAPRPPTAETHGPATKHNHRMRRLQLSASSGKDTYRECYGNRIFRNRTEQTCRERAVSKPHRTKATAVEEQQSETVPASSASRLRQARRTGGEQPAAVSRKTIRQFRSNDFLSFDRGSVRHLDNK